MSDRFAWDPLAIRETLFGLGYDVDLTDAWGTGTIRARRERGGRACVLVLDAAGRLRADLTATLDETSRADEAEAVPLRVVAVTQRIATVTTTLPALAALAPVVAALDAVADRDLPPAAALPASGEAPPR